MLFLCVLTFLISDKDHDTLREEAKELMRQIQRRNTENEPDRKVYL